MLNYVFVKIVVICGKLCEKWEFINFIPNFLIFGFLLWLTDNYNGLPILRLYLCPYYFSNSESVILRFHIFSLACCNVFSTYFSSKLVGIWPAHRYPKKQIHEQNVLSIYYLIWRRANRCNKVIKNDAII